jgi:aminopeptidase-like protein
LQEQRKLRYSYRIIFVPETIGSITYLSKNLDILRDNVKAGVNISCVGDDRTYSFLPSRRENTLSDRVAKHVLNHTDKNYVAYTWSDRGSDERQYCAPGVDLPIASIMRSKYDEYDEYHTSLDDLENVVTPAGLSGGYKVLRRALTVLERNHRYKITVNCEPQLGKRGLYPQTSGKDTWNQVQVMMDILTYCDGERDLLEIADKINVPFWDIFAIVETFLEEGLLEMV